MLKHHAGPAGHPAEEHASIGNDPLTGTTTEHDMGAPRGAPASEAAQNPAAGEAGREIPAAPMPQGLYWQTAQGPGPGVVAADAFDGCEIRNPAGETVGRVERIMVDLGCGRIAYVVLDLGAATGGRLCAVPWPAFEIDAGTPRLHVALSADDFRNAPAFSRAAWPSMTEESWVEAVHRFFGCRPYWV